jgi:phospholipid transport system substrate-binding protein
MINLPQRDANRSDGDRGRGRGSWRARIVLCCAFALVAARGQAATPDPADTVRGFYATLLGTMRHGPALGASGRYDRLEPAIRRSFDVRFMARLAVGMGWDTLSSGQQQQMTDAFERYMVATYADRFDSYSGENLEVTGQRASGPGVIVQTRIVKSNGEPIGIDYLMRRNGEEWQISDVYLEGTISELATRRSEFSAILRDRGIAGLIVELNKKSDLLAGSVPNSS